MPKTLPEHTITDQANELSKNAKELLKIREVAKDCANEERGLKKKITEFSRGFRVAKLSKDEVIGKITVAPQGQQSIRVEFRINNGSLDVEEMDNLDALFEGARPDLFEKVTIVDKIVNQTPLIDALVNAGLNPWDYLDIRVKPDMDQIIIDKAEGFIDTAEAILPKKSFLATLSEMYTNLSKSAKTYVSKYLEAALSPTVVVGTKAK